MRFTSEGPRGFSVCVARLALDELPSVVSIRKKGYEKALWWRKI